MNRSHQRVLLNLYRRIRRTGVLDSRTGARRVRADLRCVQRLVGGTGGKCAPPVGSSWRGEHRILRDAVCAEGWACRQGAGDRIRGPQSPPAAETASPFHLELGIVEILPGVLSDREGMAKLRINPDHPGDHRLAASGVDVDAYTLDGVIERAGWGRVDLIKIDVQGAEALVLAGARQILARYRPALWVEVSDLELRRMASDAMSMCGALGDAGYDIFRLRRDATLHRMTLSEVPALCSNGNYANFLFLARA